MCARVADLPCGFSARTAERGCACCDAVYGWHGGTRAPLLIRHSCVSSWTRVSHMGRAGLQRAGSRLRLRTCTGPASSMDPGERSGVAVRSGAQPRGD
eukprot:6595993-Prymnesium_polylepis.1